MVVMNLASGATAVFGRQPMPGNCSANDLTTWKHGSYLVQENVNLAGDVSKGLSHRQAGCGVSAAITPAF